MNNHRHKSKLVYLPRCEDPGMSCMYPMMVLHMRRGQCFPSVQENLGPLFEKGFGLTDLGTFIRYLHLAIFLSYSLAFIALDEII